MAIDQSKMRNFVIISHIDHGKSTLADRLIEATGTIPKEKIIPQLLDQHPIERERGITIKMQPIRLICRPSQTDDQEYIFNLIDTPGHIDFSYEVSRALACVQGALLLVDATQGIQAQTLANYYLAKQQGLAIIPVINKVDLPHAQVEQVTEQFRKLVPESPKPLKVSAKTGFGINDLLGEIVRVIPPPSGSPDAPFQALLFDSIYDRHRGVIGYVTVFSGQIQVGDGIALMATGQETIASEVGHFKPWLTPSDTLLCGEVGYIITNIKYIRSMPVGDTIIKIQNSKFKIQNEEKNSYINPLPGFQRPVPMVWATIYPNSPADTPLLRQALEKLQLNDAALQFEPESSPALGSGFRVGVLGLLHLEIVLERLERDFNQMVVVAKPSVVYRLVTDQGESRTIHSINQLPMQFSQLAIEEPWVTITIISPLPYLGQVLDLVNSRRGQIVETGSLSEDRLLLKGELPLAEMVVDFYDQLKSISSGYATLAYEWLAWRGAPLVRLDIVIADQIIEPLSQLIHRDRVEKTARTLVERLRTLVPRQLYEVKIQAVVGGKIIASERIAPFRKDVTAKLYGGDVTRKRKLLEKQKSGKKRLRQFGRIELPSEFFHEALRR